MRPVVGVTACHKNFKDYDYDCAGHPYIVAVAEGAGCVPLLIPTLGAQLAPANLLRRLDGLLLTGSLSNVEPHHYGQPPRPEGDEHDPRRDATTLPLIRQAIQQGVPLLAICRGFQELNVALGGTLYQRVHEVEGRDDHRADMTVLRPQRYHARHLVQLTPGGTLAKLTGRESLHVNSLHLQGIERLAEGLEVEAVAPDGLVEAARVRNARAFALGVQWHPEWMLADSQHAPQLFEAFGQACRTAVTEVV